MAKNKIILTEEENLEIENISLKVENIKLKAKQALDELNTQMNKIQKKLWDKYEIPEGEEWNLEGKTLAKVVNK